MGGHGFRSKRQMFTCMVCIDDVGELLQNLLGILPFNSVAKNMGQDGCWVCSCLSLNKAQVPVCIGLDLLVLNVLERSRLEEEAWQLNIGGGKITNSESFFPRNNHCRWLEMDFSTT